MKCPCLIGKNIYLRALEPEDLKGGYLEWINSAEVNKFLMAGIKPISSLELRDYYEKITRSDKDIMLAIVVKKGDRYIGNMKLGGIDWVNRHAHCGRMIGDKRYWGKGYGTEALKLVISYAFDTLNLNRVCTTAVVDNIGAIKSAEKLGMKKEGVFSQYRFINGEYRDVVQMAITMDRYNMLRKKRSDAGK